MKKAFYTSVYIGLAYVVASLIIGERHPFTFVPMYNSFPDYSYSFYLSDSSGRLLPWTTYFDCKPDYPSHLYSSICSREKIQTGNQKETQEQLNKVGQSMISELKTHQYKQIPSGMVQLHRVCYFLENGSIKEADKKMYEEAIN